MATALLTAPPPPPATGPVSAAEYLALERASPEKHEFYDGVILPMSGASFDHNRITDETLVALKLALRQTACQVVGSNLRVWIEAADAFVYPDVLVICGSPELVADQYLDTVSNPTLLVEVLSASTRAHDRGEKFALYRTIPSLQHYLLLDSRRVHAELFTRDREHVGHWHFQETTDIAAVLPLTAVGCTLALRNAYQLASFVAT